MKRTPFLYVRPMLALLAVCFFASCGDDPVNPGGDGNGPNNGDGSGGGGAPTVPEGGVAGTVARIVVREWVGGKAVDERTLDFDYGIKGRLITMENTKLDMNETAEGTVDTIAHKTTATFTYSTRQVRCDVAVSENGVVDYSLSSRETIALDGQGRVVSGEVFTLPHVSDTTRHVSQSTYSLHYDDHGFLEQTTITDQYTTKVIYSQWPVGSQGWA